MCSLVEEHGEHHFCGLLGQVVEEQDLVGKLLARWLRDWYWRGRKGLMSLACGQGLKVKSTRPTSGSHLLCCSSGGCGLCHAPLGRGSLLSGASFASCGGRGAGERRQHEACGSLTILHLPLLPLHICTISFSSSIRLGLAVGNTLKVGGGGGGRERGSEGELCNAAELQALQLHMK